MSKQNKEEKNTISDSTLERVVSSLSNSFSTLEFERNCSGFIASSTLTPIDILKSTDLTRYDETNTIELFTSEYLEKMNKKVPKSSGSSLIKDTTKDVAKGGSRSKQKVNVVSSNKDSSNEFGYREYPVYKHPSPDRFKTTQRPYVPKPGKRETSEEKFYRENEPNYTYVGLDDDDLRSTNNAHAIQDKKTTNKPKKPSSKDVTSKRK